MFDPELKYCPECNDEYRADIHKCHACQCSLLTGDEMIACNEDHGKKKSAGPMAITPDDDLVAVKHGPLAEIRVYEELLNRKHICTVLAGDESSCGKGCCGGNFDLLVRQVEAHTASQLIAAEIRRTAVIDSAGELHNDSVFDPLAQDNICPACGHQFSGGMECPDCGLCF